MSKDDDCTDDEGGVLLTVAEDVGEPLAMGRTVDVEVGSGVNATTYRWKRVASIPKDERAGEPRFDLQVHPPPLITIHAQRMKLSFVCTGPQPEPQHHHEGSGLVLAYDATLL